MGRFVSSPQGEDYTLEGRKRGCRWREEDGDVEKEQRHFIHTSGMG
jgi:hypothetical protein